MCRALLTKNMAFLSFDGGTTSFNETGAYDLFGFNENEIGFHFHQTHNKTREARASRKNLYYELQISSAARRGMVSS